MKCPRCQAQLASDREGAAVYHACPECAGLWFGPGELRRMLGGGPQAASIAEARHVPVREPGRAGAAVCPECGHQLTNYTYAYDSAVEVDGCEHCGGVFLEDGELAAIQKWGEEQSRPDANVEALAAMVSASERTKRRAERIGALARVAMMRRSWLVWDTSDLLEPVDLDHD